MRPDDVHATDSRARAAERTATLLGHGGLDEEASDNFAIPDEMIPEGWTYEWKRISTYGKEDPSYEVATARKGWEAVPAERHPELMPKDGKHSTIDRDGMRLCERPAEITARAKEREFRAAKAQMRAKEEQLGAAPDGQFARVDQKGKSTVKVDKKYEYIPIPEE